MLKPLASAPNYDRWLYLFLAVHLLTWTLVPYSVRYTLPMDSLEGAIWGQHFEWGYDKNPFVNAWLTALAVHIDQHHAWAIYLFSQLSVVVGFWAIWRLAKNMLPPVYALLAVLFLEGVQYYNVHAIDFNDNTLELCLWPLCALYFYQAMQTQSRRDWILTGVFAGLGMMTKYYTGMLLLPMFLFLIALPQNRFVFKKPEPYWCLAVCMLICLPHFIWLFFHDFVTLDYALFRVSAKPKWTNHFVFPGIFTSEQIKAILPTLALCLLLLLGRRPFLEKPRFQLTSFDKAFLGFIGAGPFLLTIMLSLATGMRLRAGWGQPLLSMWGILLMAWIQPYITKERFQRFMVLFYLVMVIALVSYSAALIRAPEPSSANFPGEMIAKTLTDEWRNTYHTPLHYVAGSRWMAGNIAFYSHDHPSVYINWDSRVSPWINLSRMKKKGAIFVWDMVEETEKLPPEIIPQYPKLGPMRIMHFTWLRNKGMKPVEVGVAFLPPA